MRAGDLKGLKLGDAVGEKIGEVDAIVRDKGTGTLQAVVSVGGFLGIGAELVTIPLDDLKLEGEGLMAHQASTKEELKAQPAFNEALYEEVPAGQRVDLGPSLDVERAQEVAGSDSGKGAAEGSTFNQLDADEDGYLSKAEAKEDIALTGLWDAIDSNGDDRIDQAEFAAFEVGGSTDVPEHQGTPGDTLRGNGPGEEQPGSGEIRDSGGGSGQAIH